jgi:hypothetical protein
VAEHEARATGGRGTVRAFDEIAIGAAHARRNGLNQHRAVRRIRLRHIVEANRCRQARMDGDRFHPCSGFAGTFMKPRWMTRPFRDSSAEWVRSE